MWVERLSDALAHLAPGSYSKEQQGIAQQALDSLQANAASAKLDVPLLTRLESLFSKAAAHASVPEASAPKPAAGQKGGQSLSPEFFSTQSGLQLGNERENRRTLLTVAELVNQQDAYDPTGYQLRRFALWSHINSSPTAGRDQRTELMCVPVDIVEAYQEALAGNHVDPTLLQRVEKSVVSSPYWIRGSFIAAGIAARLEMKEVSTAIRQATERFLRRIPTLLELRFNDNRPFVDAQTHSWLSGADAEAEKAGAVQEYGGLREDLLEQLEREGVEVVLRRLQEMQAEVKSPRQRCYVTVIAADLLASRGLAWLADDLYARVEKTMQDTPAHEWEPDLYGHLSQRKNTVLQTQKNTKA